MLLKPICSEHALEGSNSSSISSKTKELGKLKVESSDRKGLTRLESISLMSRGLNHSESRILEFKTLKDFRSKNFKSMAKPKSESKSVSSRTLSGPKHKSKEISRQKPFQNRILKGSRSYQLSVRGQRKTRFFETNHQRSKQVWVPKNEIVNFTDGGNSKSIKEFSKISQWISINCRGRKAYAPAHYFLVKIEDCKNSKEEDDYWKELVTECQEYYDDK
ncbi:hypothetical protein A2U01_0000780 [Trifolium medium]|uniref:Uncharacterized protein n=1 Tax=Trifolium medium TaxID=97028 RepID=A0A392LZ66_9FABA|nr:hypothetical protein [Trifolium medium]